MASHHPPRCQECGLVDQLYAHRERFVCRKCLVALRLEEGWAERRAAQLIRNKLHSQRTQNIKKFGPSGAKPGPKPIPKLFRTGHHCPNPTDSTI